MKHICNFWTIFESAKEEFININEKYRKQTVLFFSLLFFLQIFMPIDGLKYCFLSKTCRMYYVDSNSLCLECRRLKLCGLVVSMNLRLPGRLASGNTERQSRREHTGEMEGRESSSWLSWQQGNAPWDRVFPR